MTKIESPNKNDCIIDVSVGGFKIPSYENGSLCVWIVTLKGELFFRKGINHSDVEGTEWKKMKLPDSVRGVLKCSCSPIGHLVLVTHEGKCLIRLGANREAPWGNEWIIVDQPDAFSIREISIGDTQIWSLDEQELVYYRAGITETAPLGSKWVRISKEFKATSLTVSSSNQVWCVNSNDSQVYFRDGVDAENMSGIEWKKVCLKCKRAQKELDQISLRSDTIRKQIEASNSVFPSSQQQDANTPQEGEPEIQPNFVDEDFSIYDDNSSFDSSKFDGIMQTKASNSSKDFATRVRIVSASQRTSPVSRFTAPTLLAPGSARSRPLL